MLSQALYSHANEQPTSQFMFHFMPNTTYNSIITLHKTYILHTIEKINELIMETSPNSEKKTTLKHVHAPISLKLGVLAQATE